MGVPFPALKTMVTVVLLLMGNMSPVHPISTPSAVASIASSIIRAGASLHGVPLQSLAEPGYRVTCVMQVENWTRYALVGPAVLTVGAPAISVAPTSILPAKIEAFAVRKPSATATGTSGTVSWELQGADRRFVLMWSTPYNFNHYSNWMGVGMTKEGITTVAEGNTWFNQMYYKGNSDSLKFKRGEFYYNVEPVIYRDEKFEIVGLMTNVHRAEVKVVIRPISKEGLAVPIQSLLAEQRDDYCT